jgi:hypothetical protein
MMNDLTLYQQAAIQTVRNRALNLRTAAQREIDAVLERHAVRPWSLDASMAAMRDGARIGLHFHPERLSRDGVSVAEGLLRTRGSGRAGSLSRLRPRRVYQRR